MPKISHLLIPISSQRATEGNGFKIKTDQKSKIMGVKIAWVETKSNQYPSWLGLNSIYENYHRKKINIFGDSESVRPTHISDPNAFFKIQKNFQNRIPRKLDQKFRIHQHDSLRHFHFFEIKKSLRCGSFYVCEAISS